MAAACDGTAKPSVQKGIKSMAPIIVGAQWFGVVIIFIGNIPAGVVVKKVEPVRRDLFRYLLLCC